MIGHIRAPALVKAAEKPGKATGAMAAAPGDDVWHSQKCFHIPIEFQQNRLFNCLSYSLASALFQLGDRHVCCALIGIANDLNKLSWKEQCFKVKEVYNKVFRQNKIYGLGEASVISNNKDLKK